MLLNELNEFWLYMSREKINKSYDLVKGLYFQIKYQWPKCQLPPFSYYDVADTWENRPSDMCAQRRLKSACASAQSDQSLRYPHEDTLYSGYPKCTQWKSDQTARMRSLIWIFPGRTWSYVFWHTLISPRETLQVKIDSPTYFWLSQLTPRATI